MKLPPYLTQRGQRLAPTGLVVTLDVHDQHACRLLNCRACEAMAADFGDLARRRPS